MSVNNEVLARNTELAPKTLGSHTVAFSHYNNFSAQLPLDPKTGQLVEGGIREQAQQCFENLKAVIESIDHVLSDVVRLSIFVKDIQDVDTINLVQKEYFPTYAPSRTVVAVDDLPMQAKVQMDAIISNGEGTIPNAPQAGDLIKLTNNTYNAPVSALSTQTVAFSHYNNVTAQLPIDPKTGRLAIGGVKEQAIQCLKNIKAVLESIDVALDDVVKMTVYVTDLADLDAINEVYKTFLPDSGIARAVNYLPARTVVPVAALEMGALVQMEATVSHGDGTPPQAIEDRHGLIIEHFNTEKAPKCDYSSQTVAFSHYNHISAQLPLAVSTGDLVAGGVKEQAQQCFDHIQAIIESVDHVMADVVKINVYMTDLAAMASVEEVFSTVFAASKPALRFVGVSELPKGAMVQIDATVGNAEGTPPVA
ncbi:RidA family protein [Streptococcus uberis]|uniref:RidA family protein n=1 Tax=Streptococcus uberis TaxID=1349 RepID=UPI0006202FB5|nr:RidA family protein [Streptococcus uberis]KKF45517.1 endoribonuclease L-PSP [Streptococcus uberis Ab71]MTB34640.1 reactive intermediate/imine deaminase [Streptococcus uberis]MTB37079.1 reactive intermediate/imine deaminase [Streptococcus uberis]MTB55841.1 reactive intermediate/imine deaminase [Streptococcus uberis]MTB60613.1 reactive intermediate/imine deaminase [Streptococcus uberis]